MLSLETAGGQFRVGYMYKGLLIVQFAFGATYCLTNRSGVAKIARKIIHCLGCQDVGFV